MKIALKIFLLVYAGQLWAACPDLPQRSDIIFKSDSPNWAEMSAQGAAITSFLSSHNCSAATDEQKKAYDAANNTIKALTAQKGTQGADETLIDAGIRQQNEIIANMLKDEWSKKLEENCKQAEMPDFTSSSSDKELVVDVATYKVASLESMDKCLDYLKVGLEKEKEVTSAAEDSNLVKDLQKLESYRSEVANNLKSAEAVLASKSEKSYDEQREQFEKEGKFANLYTTNKWYSAFSLGVKLSPEYDENGQNKGFKESNVYASFSLDARWPQSNDKMDVAVTQDATNSLGWIALYPYVNVDFYSAPVVNCSKLEDPAKQADCKDETTDLDKLDFNDVSNTVNASVGFWEHFYQSPTRQLEIGVGGRVGMQSRDKLGKDGDSINAYHMAGVRFVYNDFMTQKDPNGKTYQNGMPRFELQINYAELEDYANTDRKGYRKIVYGRYRIVEDQPVHVGLLVNGGRGPDEIALTLQYGLNAENFLSFLGK